MRQNIKYYIDINLSDIITHLALLNLMAFTDVSILLANSLNNFLSNCKFMDGECPTWSRYMISGTKYTIYLGIIDSILVNKIPWNESEELVKWSDR